VASETVMSNICAIANSTTSGPVGEVRSISRPSPRTVGEEAAREQAPGPRADEHQFNAALEKPLDAPQVIRRREKYDDAAAVAVEYS
jgi:hypothetical protein